MPVIYTGFGTLGYFIYANQSHYKDYKQALKFRTDDDPATVDIFPQYSAEGLLQAKNYYRRNLELSYIFTVVLYALNVVDAAVDAHFYEFDINDNLSLKMQPVLFDNTLTPGSFGSGIRLTLKL